MARSLHLVSGAAMLSILAQSAAALAVDCFVDSVGGNDANNGTSETTAWKSPAKIGSTCTVVKFKRGSEFAVAKGKYAVDLMTLRNIKTLTNYGDAGLPLPKFIKQREKSSGAMLASYMGGVTIDGLYLSGSQSDTAMGSLVDGICVMLGADSKILNSEVTLCDIGMMTAGDNVQVLHNYVHDLFISVDGDPGIDPNAVGGAEGIFVNSSHVEVAYNRFVNCTIPAKWVTTTGGNKRCDGGATEVTVPYGKEVTDVRIHNNFSLNSCGFFEVSSMFQPDADKAAGLPYVKGKFTNSAFYNNVMIDSGWISLLQVNNTRLTNVRWENNTIVHHDLGKDADGTDLNDFASSYIQAIAFNDTSSGVTGGGVIEAGDIYWTNNVWYFDPKFTYLSPVDSDALLKNIVQKNNLVLRVDPGFVNLAGKTNPSDFDLVKGSQLIDKGTNLAEITSDFLDRPAPVGTQDVGAFEYQGDSAGGVTGSGGTTASSTGGTTATNAGGTTSTGGVKSTGGTTATNAGGTTSTGGVKSAGGTSTNVTGGSATVAVGGSTIGGGSSATGGVDSTTGTPQGGQAATGGTSAPSSGGQTVASSGSPASVGGQTSGTATGQGGNSATEATGGAAEGVGIGADEGGCSCRVAERSSNGTAAAGLLALGALLFSRSRRRRDQ